MRYSALPRLWWGLFVIACGGTDPNAPPPPPPPQLAIGVIEADTVAPVATQTRVTVEVSSNGAPAPNVIVNFIVTKGGGTVFAGVGLTDTLGRVRDVWTLGTVADTQVLEARAVDPATGDPIVYATATLRATPGPIVAAVMDTTPIRVFLGDSVALLRSFTATDRYGNVVDTTPTWQPTASWRYTAPWLVNLGATSDRVGWTIGPITGSIETTAVPDLFVGRSYTLDFSCERLTGGTTLFTGAVDSVSYRQSPGYNPLIGGVLQVHYTVRDDWQGASWSATQRVEVFSPDSLVYLTTQNEALGTGIVQGGTITGGNWCWAISYQHRTYGAGVLTAQ